MNESDARAVLLVRAIEENDPNGEVWPRAMRAEATRQAELAESNQPEVEAKGRLTEMEIAGVIRRAWILYAEFERRFPGLERIVNRCRWPAFIAPILAFCAFGAGLLSNELGPGKRVNILAFPLLGMLAWNLGVYLLLGIEALHSIAHRPGRASPGGTLTGWISHRVTARFSFPGKPEFDLPKPLSAGLKQFVSEWLRHSGLAYAARARLTLHWAAASLALGAVAGMYLRGLALEYKAGWESTFLDARAVHALTSTLFAPASWMTGIALPDAASIQAIRWNANPAGTNAAPWIHLYAATAGWMIVFPRLALAGLERWKARRHFSLLEPIRRQDAYFRRVLAPGGGAGWQVVVISYGLELASASRERMRSALLDLFGWKARIEFTAPIRYGEEEQIATVASGHDDQVCWAIVFNLAATPEPENHGALLEELKRAAADPQYTRQLLVLVDESSYRSRFEGQSGFQHRLGERRRHWTRFVEGHGLQFAALELKASAPEPDALRAALWPVTTAQTPRP